MSKRKRPVLYVFLPVSLMAFLVEPVEVELSTRR
jgi:hypothetical protein